MNPSHSSFIYRELEPSASRDLLAGYFIWGSVVFNKPCLSHCMETGKQNCCREKNRSLDVTINNTSAYPLLTENVLPPLSCMAAWLQDTGSGPCSRARVAVHLVLVTVGTLCVCDGAQTSGKLEGTWLQNVKPGRMPWPILLGRSLQRFTLHMCCTSSPVITSNMGVSPSRALKS